ncbi:MAG: DNA repair protein RadC [Bacteroidota bacterium]|jgi:DNA repair protein RadC|nr:DNA repair protein RadC [Bacteroidota bacterium]
MESTNKSSTSIKNWAVDDRPREKLMLKGKESLSDSELLAILINTGSGKKSAVDLARELLKLGKNNLDELGKVSIKDFMTIPGIGNAKAVTITAALELGRRRHASTFFNKSFVRSSNELAEFLKASLKDYAYEVFAVVFLNRSNKINHFEVLSKGGLTHTIADPRVIFKKAIEVDATSLILCHNHPSGNLRPSRVDEELTSKLKEAGKLLEIKVLDHLIVSDEGYYSFADEGLI